LRTYRPRILIHGPQGMGQAWLGPAILHHLEGFHVQSLDLGTLMGDSSRTVEAGLVQLFVEAKRHQPSVIFIPSLNQWSAAISDTARSTLNALLDGVPSSDPILILALVDGEVRDLPRDLRSWFGLGRENRLTLEGPSTVCPLTQHSNCGKMT
jgi:SpoVK/Ycf46/Vps4 family AAA+-type ATPase